MKTALFWLVAGLALASAAPALANTPAQGVEPTTVTSASGHGAGMELALASTYKSNSKASASRRSPPPVPGRKH